MRLAWFAIGAASASVLWLILLNGLGTRWMDAILGVG